MPPIRCMRLQGSPFEMGFEHGTIFREDIRQITEERIHLCSAPTWTGHAISREQALELAEACLPAHYAYAPTEMQQIEGMAAATGLSVAELIITNGFTDFVDVIYNAYPHPQPARVANECTAFLVGSAAAYERQAMLGQTWDMHATATPYVILIHSQPDDGPAYMTFTITGCLAMVGMNAAGIAVGINNLGGADGQPGVTWPFVCHKILRQTTIEDALACITDAPLAGAHNYLLLDGQGRGYNIEAMSTATHITELGSDVIAHANICLMEATQAVERPHTDQAILDSTTRVRRATRILDKRQLNPDDLMALTRDRSDGSFSICARPEPPYYSETCGAMIMRPGTGDVWAVWGQPTQADYEHFRLTPA